MSTVMLDDKNTMDDINPFLDFMPGSSRQPHAFGEYTQLVEEPEEKPYKSPSCDVVSKNVGRPGYRKERCDLSRPLLPGRNIDKGFTNPGYHLFGVEKAIESGRNIDKGFTNPGYHIFGVEKAIESGKNSNFIMNMISLMCLILLIVMF